MVKLTRSHIPAGSFQVCKGEAMLLQAYLGTCVGLAIYCKSSGVGGLIHFLLPEPVATIDAVHPERYASTGVPLFLQALEQKGARRKTMTACLAGGALVGPLSRQDLNLDIGGRTTDKVREILQAENIPIDRSETGGFFTCCLSLNTRTGDFSIKPADYPEPPETTDLKIPNPVGIKQAIDQLRPIPQVALKLMRMMDASGYDIEAICKEIRKDQVIAAQVLKLANSALFGAKRSIETLDHALVFLGQDRLYKVVISAAVQSYFGQAPIGGYSLCKGGLYFHAVGCAQAVEALARHTGKTAPERAYTAGLLHDIGKVVLDQYAATANPLFYRSMIEEGRDIIGTERQLIGIDHTEVGHRLARRWVFPETLTQVIRFHHTPDQSGQDNVLAHLVYLADLLLSRFNIGIEIERVDTGALGRYIEALNMQDADLALLVDKIPQTVFAAGTKDMLGIV